jgi:hypothetical protein
MSNIPSPLLTPDLPQLLSLKTREVLMDTHCAKVGTVMDFNAAKQTATISLVWQVRRGNVLKEYPVLADVPVFTLGGGDRVFTFPVRRGDTCLVVFADRDIDSWFASGNTAAPNTPRIHDLSDGMAFIGFRSLANPVKTYSTQDVEVRNGTSSVSVGTKILIKNGTTDLLDVLQAVMNAISALDSVKIGASAAGQIAIANAALTELLKH